MSDLWYWCVRCTGAEQHTTTTTHAASSRSSSARCLHVRADHCTLQLELDDVFAFNRPPSTEGLQPTPNRSFHVPGSAVPITVADDGALVIGSARLLTFTYRSYSAVDMSNYVAQYRLNQNGSASAECGDAVRFVRVRGGGVCLFETLELEATVTAWSGVPCCPFPCQSRDGTTATSVLAGMDSVCSDSC